MKDLNEKVWKEFEIKELFNIENGNGETQKNTRPGDIPYVSATNNNNGIVKYTDCIPRHLGKTISISDFGVAYYQEKAYSGTHIIVLNPKFKINKYIGHFITTCITKSLYKKYSFGYSVSIKRFPKERILLPINNRNLPDYKFMEEYIKTLWNDQVNKNKEFIEKQLSKLQYKKIPNLEDLEWKEFFIEEIFSIKSGKRLEKRNMVRGTIPFIGSSDSHNGITNYVSNINKTLDKNVLGVNYNGSVVQNFYHPYECIFSDDVKRFHLLHYADNKYVFLFFKNIILQQKGKYRYGYKFNEKRMKRQIIMVPTKHSIPYYEYMKQYMMNMEFLMLKKCLEYIK